jgi:uncharacterized HAD superfamily protein
MQRSIDFWVGIDIDGTLGDYHSHFLRCAEMFLQRPMPDPKDINPLLPLHRHMGLPKHRYREIKMAYRQGRWKRSMPAFDYARQMTVDIRKSGAKVAICTTRPFNQLGEVDADTRWWLRHHGIQHDLVIWGPHKYRDLIKVVGRGNIVAVVDDELEQMERCHNLDLPFYLRDQPYNRDGLSSRGKCLRIDTLEDATKRILKDLEYARGRVSNL